MAIPNEALAKLIQEIENKAIASQQQIELVRTQMATKQRELRLVRLTLSEVDSIPSSTKVYEGMGKMFIASPAEDVQTKLESQAKDAESQLEKMGQRLHYLETTHKNSRSHIDKVLNQNRGFGS